MAKEKLSIKVDIDKGAALRQISRKTFGHLPTKSIPDKKTKYTRQPKHRKSSYD